MTAKHSVGKGVPSAQNVPVDTAYNVMTSLKVLVEQFKPFQLL